MTVELSDRDKRIIGLIDCGARTEEIAVEIGLSKWTTRDRIRRLGVKLQAETMIDLPELAREQGIELPGCPPVCPECDSTEMIEDDHVWLCRSCGYESSDV